MTENTPRLALPLLQPGQAQKEMFHNSALIALDFTVQAAIVAADVDAPPASPELGQSWIVGSAPTGSWAGRSGQVAGWTSGGWIFVSPREGMRFWIEEESVWATFRSGSWRSGELYGKVFVEGDQVVGPRGPSIAEPAGGMTVDAEARAAIISVLEALRGHGLIAFD